MQPQYLTNPDVGFGQRQQRGTGRAADWLVNVGPAIAVGFRRWRIRRATVRALDRIDDRLLRDIGLTRGDIRPVARQLARSAAASGSSGQVPARRAPVGRENQAAGGIRAVQAGEPLCCA